MGRHNNRSEEEAQLAAQLFALLLRGFARYRRQDGSSVDRLRFLLNGFDEVVSVEDVPVEPRGNWAELFAGHLEAIGRDRIEQESVADDFNLLDVLGATYKETKHSMVLAWLLDGDHRRHGTHAQGNLGFRLFLQAMKLPEHFAEGRYWVGREVSGDEARVDVEIASRGRFLIHIENKIWAGEGYRQAERELADLERRAMALDISNPAMVIAIFLTPDGRSASHSAFRAVSWREVAEVLEDFAIAAKPLDVRLFAAHYARALRRFVVREELRNEVEHA